MASEQSPDVDSIIARVQDQNLAKQPAEEEVVHKARGASLLLGKKPKYQSRAKRNENKVLPVADEGVGVLLQSPKQEERPSINPLLAELHLAKEKKKELGNIAPVVEETKEKVLSLDEELRKKRQTAENKTLEEAKAAALLKEAEDAQILKDTRDPLVVQRSKRIR